MKYRFGKVAAILFAIGVAYQPGYSEGPITRKSRLKKIVVTTFYRSFNHVEGWAKNNELISEIANEMGASVTTFDNANNFTKASLDGVGLLILNCPSGILNNKDNVIREYLYGGGSIFGLHSIPDGNNPPWLTDSVMYWRYDGHPGDHPLVEVVLDPEANRNNNIHPAIEGIKPFLGPNNTVKWAEEWFKLGPGNTPRNKKHVTMLLTLKMTAGQCACSYEDKPMAFLHDSIGPGNGKFIYTITGHDKDIHQFRNQGLKGFWKSSMEYLGGLDYLGCTKPGFEEFNAKATVDNSTCKTPTTSAFLHRQSGLPLLSVNGSNGMVFINAKTAFSLDIHDALGNRLESITGSGPRMVIPTSFKSKGTYFLRLKEGKRSTIEKAAIQ